MLFTFPYHFGVLYFVWMYQYMNHSSISRHSFLLYLNVTIYCSLLHSNMCLNSSRVPASLSLPHPSLPPARCTYLTLGFLLALLNSFMSLLHPNLRTSSTEWRPFTPISSKLDNSWKDFHGTLQFSSSFSFPIANKEYIEKNKYWDLK